MGCGIFFRRAGRYWANFSKFIVSLLKAGYGDAASPENDFGFSWLPRVDADYSHWPSSIAWQKARSRAIS